MRFKRSTNAVRSSTRTHPPPGVFDGDVRAVFGDVDARRAQRRRFGRGRIEDGIRIVDVGVVFARARDAAKYLQRTSGPVDGSVTHFARGAGTQPSLGKLVVAPKRSVEHH